MSFQTHSPNINNSDEGIKEFSFWSTSPNTIITKSSEKCDCYNTQLGGNETRIFNNHCSRSKDILEGKNELMDMMQDMSESCYELSFQDMVVEQQHQVLQSETETETESVCSKAQNLRHEKLKKKNKKKKKENKNNSRHGKILRVESMDSETFLLKMFFPTSLDWMKKTTKVQNGSKVEQKDKEWRIKRFFTEDKQNTSSSSSSGNDKSRYVDRSTSFSQSCFPFFHDIKSKSKKLGGG